MLDKHPWLELEPFYDWEPHFVKRTLPENSIKKMVRVYFSQYAKKEMVEEAIQDYLEQHQALMRAHPHKSPFVLTPNIIEIKKRGQISLGDLIWRVYSFNKEYPENWQKPYIESIVRKRDSEPYVVQLRSMMMVREMHLIIGKQNAENFLDYHLKLNQRDEPEGEIFKAKFGMLETPQK